MRLGVKDQQGTVLEEEPIKESSTQPCKKKEDMQGVLQGLCSCLFFAKSRNAMMFLSLCRKLSVSLGLEKHLAIMNE
jgi:hypothetical protein